MTLPHPIPANAVARHVAPEDFRSFAHRELSEFSPWQAGICFRPECGRVFEPRRSWQICSWQIYCCAECERAGRAELRRWGHRMALSALIWRMGKYERRDMALREVARAARRHVGLVQSAWLSDRQVRAHEGGRK